MKHNLFEGEGLTPQQVRENLEGMCTGKREMNFFKSLTADELNVEKDNLSQHAIRIQAVKEEKKRIDEDFKDRLKKLDNHFFETLDVIKTGGVAVEEHVYEVPDYESRMMNFYDCNGILVNSRPMTPEERQRDLVRDSMFIARNGTLD